MSTMLLAPAREGYPSAGPEGRLGAAGRDHEAEDLIRGWCHERMGDAEEPVDVVTRTHPWYNAHFTCRYDMILVVHPPVVYIIIRDP